MKSFKSTIYNFFIDNFKLKQKIFVLHEIYAIQIDSKTSVLRVHKQKKGLA